MSKRPALAEADGAPPAQRQRHVPGGLRQQLEWSAPGFGQAEADPLSGSLTKLLITKWSWGVFSAHLVQELAAASVDDGVTDPFTKKLAKIGSSGRLQQHCHGDLLRLLPPTHVHEALFDFSVWVAKPPSGFMQAHHQVLLPHQLFHVIYTRHKQIFMDRIVGGSEQNISDFWESMVNHPALTDHPLHRRSNYTSKCIPLALHGDGVPVAGRGKSWSKSMDAYSWTSLLSTGPVSESVFLIYAMVTKLAVHLPNRNFTEEFFKLLSWSFLLALLGCLAEEGLQGPGLSGGVSLGAAGGSAVSRRLLLRTLVCAR